MEVKLPAASAEEARGRLAEAGFLPATARLFEANSVFDTEDAVLRQRRCLLRLRDCAGEAIVTFKGPPEPGPHKSRPEHETRVEDAAQLILILRGLGYRETFRYEKYRTVYARMGDDGHALLDETPIGVWLELEGAPEWIDRVAAELGYQPADYVLESYGALYLQHCERSGVQPTHMVFSAASTSGDDL